MSQILMINDFGRIILKRQKTLKDPFVMLKENVKYIMVMIGGWEELVALANFIHELIV